MPKARDLMGQQFGRLTVTSLGPYLIRGARRVRFKTWWCVCDCGVEKLFEMNNLMKGTTKSCGCLKRELNRAPVSDLYGRTFGRLTVIDRERVAAGRFAWRCRCACGGTCLTDGYRLTDGVVKSCGCYRREASHLVQARQDARIPEELKPDHRRARLKKNVEVLADWYVRARIRDSVTGLKNPPVSLVQAKRAHLRVQRLLNEEKQ